MQNTESKNTKLQTIEDAVLSMMEYLILISGFVFLLATLGYCLTDIMLY
jgi:hypothetical protein